jgi:hypothetical protein
VIATMALVDSLDEQYALERLLTAKPPIPEGGAPALSVIRAVSLRAAAADRDFAYERSGPMARTKWRCLR